MHVGKIVSATLRIVLLKSFVSSRASGWAVLFEKTAHGEGGARAASRTRSIRQAEGASPREARKETRHDWERRLPLYDEDSMDYEQKLLEEVTDILAKLERFYPSSERDFRRLCIC